MSPIHDEWTTDDGSIRLLLGDCLEVMPTLAACSADSIVTDPPYGLAFMAKDWDHGVPGVHFWQEALRVAKPGAHLLAFGGTRTYHRLACAIEDAGWEIRDCIMWVYGSGFPKSLDVSKAIDKQAGAEREVVGKRTDGRYAYLGCDITGGRTVGGESGVKEIGVITAPATPEAVRWQGWGTALKPAWEPVIVARKPLAGTVAENVLSHGTGAINVDGCRISGDGNKTFSRVAGDRARDQYRTGTTAGAAVPTDIGRWPANLIHDGSDEVLAAFPEGKPSKLVENFTPTGPNFKNAVYGRGMGGNAHPGFADTSGSAARFFYCAKASKADRDEGCEGLEYRTPGEMVDREEGSAGINNPRAGAGGTGGARNHHPTVKPTDLMRYLCRLVTPPGGVVLDPFAGSGSTGKGAVLEGFRFVGIEREAEYFEIAKARIAAKQKPLPLFAQTSFLEPVEATP